MNLDDLRGTSMTLERPTSFSPPRSIRNKKARLRPGAQRGMLLCSAAQSAEVSVTSEFHIDFIVFQKKYTYSIILSYYYTYYIL